MGFVSRSHGVKGEIFVHPFNESFQWPVKHLDQIFLNRRPFLVKTCHLYKTGLRFLLQDIDTREKAKALVGHTVFLSKHLFETKKKGEFYLFELQDFTVHVRGKGEVGRVKNFTSTGSQDILLIKGFNLEEILIPFVEDYIESIYFQKKILFLNLPEGFPGISDKNK